ncbi:hypothetical protein GCM10027046_15000 [Uliginosibacterium flavum]
MMSHARNVAMCLGVWLLSCGTTWGAQRIEAWSYYPVPPFQTEDVSNAGLTADLVVYLNKALSGKYDVNLVMLPKARLNKMLERGDKAFVAFTPSVVFDGPNGGSYLWTAPLFEDRQELVSRAKQPFEFNGPASLFGVRFGALLGHIYPMLAKEMESGVIHADRTTSEASLIAMLMAGHVDVITIPNSAVRYYMSTNTAFRQGFWISRQHLGEYTRHLMFQRGMEKERDDFDQIIRKMNVDPAWIGTLKKYGLEPASRKTR